MTAGSNGSQFLHILDKPRSRGYPGILPKVAWDREGDLA